ncbi:hypothetical protein DERF_010160 [Dermatophagoides farinae]|uniref:Uncharacterized protein n=1 Tax=Dermatophagoides farinae TaxID=6954 RepID=A0A922HY18_DERFA|nr:hypothetical protein DERF_010160 [Dermatophagoides farinae]
MAIYHYYCPLLNLTNELAKLVKKIANNIFLQCRNNQDMRKLNLGRQHRRRRRRRKKNQKQINFLLQTFPGFFWGVDVSQLRLKQIPSY